MLTAILKAGQQTMSDPQDIRDELKKVLKKIVLGQIKKLHKSAELTGKNFNVFSILDRERKEVTTHSAIIAELLNPHGSHSQKTLFLKIFLDQLLKKLQQEQKAQEELKPLRKKLKQIQEQEKDEFDKFRVEVETSKKDKEGEALGRIDILIESHGIESGDVCIVIENKIDAGDQERQIDRYNIYASDTEKKHGIIYLNLDGKGPNEVGKIPLVCLSYEEFIDEWLDACIEKVAHIPQIKETLHQYQMTVRKLTEKPTGQLPPEVEDILNKDILGENYEELKGEIIESVQHELQYDFWMELKKQLAYEKPKFQLYKSKMNHAEILDKDLYTELIEEIEKSYYSSLGLTFSIPKGLLDDGEHEVAFRVQYESPSKEGGYFQFNYGFVFRKKDTLQRDKFEKGREDIGQYKIKDWPEGGGNDGWISWKYFRYKPERFITESKETLIRRLTSEINSLLWQSRGDKEKQ